MIFKATYHESESPISKLLGSGEWGNICSVYDNEVSKNGFILWSRL